jgi:tetratricopeptide (TPR) repeat protein
MNHQERYDDAMFDYSRGDYDSAIAKLRSLLATEASFFDAQLALGMAYYRKGDYATAVAEGKKAELMRPQDQLVHTNLSLCYMKAGDKVAAEHHGLQARIAGWREDPEAKHITGSDPDLQLAKPKPPAVPPPEKFPDMPWKKKPPVDESPTH